MAPTKRTAQDDGPYPAGPSKSRAREASDLSRPPHLGSGLSALELANRVNGPKAAGDAQNADDIDPATGERVGVRFEPPPLGFSDEHAVLTIEQQLGWQSVPHDVLNTYRWAHRLATPMPWHDKLHAAVLTNKGIGRHSPTAIAHLRSKRQQMLDKDGLLAANGGGAIAKGDGPRPAWRARAELVGKVRRHFNAMPADETVAAVELIYKVRNQGQGFRMRSVQKKAAAPNASAAVVTMTTTSGL